MRRSQLPNGVVTSYGYNTLDRLPSYTYTLRAEGNRGQVAELGGRTVAYTYNDAYRLLSETISGGSPNGTISYGYDVVGNRTSRTSTVAGIPSVASYTYDNNDRLSGNTYNNNGNTTVSGGVTYSYDFRDLLTSATDGLSFVYDGDGNRVSQTASGTTTQYLVDDLDAPAADGIDRVGQVEQAALDRVGVEAGKDIQAAVVGGGAHAAGRGEGLGHQGNLLIGRVEVEAGLRQRLAEALQHGARLARLGLLHYPCLNIRKYWLGRNFRSSSNAYPACLSSSRTASAGMR
jgi:YD repeat-containing protein